MGKSDAFKQLKGEAAQKVNKKIEQKTSGESNPSSKTSKKIAKNKKIGETKVMSFTIEIQTEEDFTLLTNFQKQNRSELVRQWIRKYNEKHSDILVKLKSLQ